jgi:two-component sensor histidine kinase
MHKNAPSNLTAGDSGGFMQSSVEARRDATDRCLAALVRDQSDRLSTSHDFALRNALEFADKSLSAPRRKAMRFTEPSTKNFGRLLRIRGWATKPPLAMTTEITGAETPSNNDQPVVCGVCNIDIEKHDAQDCRLSDTIRASALALPPGAVVSEHDAAAIAALSIDRLRINLGEVQHRVKNMVAVLQSISHQTMRQSMSKEDFDERFCGRLDAFCRSLDLLVANEWRVLNIEELVRSQLSPFGLIDGTQISGQGPELKLLAGNAHSIGLALHELATNAVKYGALSVADGNVEVKWGIRDSGAGACFFMSWQESGGPPVSKPIRTGFGRKMIERLTKLALAGQTSHEFVESGVRWTLDAPVSVAVTA